MKRNAIILLFLFFYGLVSAQSTKNIKKYFDTGLYSLIDSVYLIDQHNRLYILYDEMDESIIVHKKNDSFFTYEGFLSCYTCKGRGSKGSTYSGYIKKGRFVVFIQDYFSGRDSVFVDFSKSNPSIQKIIRRAYFNEKVQGPDDAGNYIFLAKKDAPITKFHLPLDRKDPLVMEYFNIRRIKWRKL
jgi:hypothetical protein